LFGDSKRLLTYCKSENKGTFCQFRPYGAHGLLAICVLYDKGITASDGEAHVNCIKKYRAVQTPSSTNNQLLANELFLLFSKIGCLCEHTLKLCVGLRFL